MKRLILFAILLPFSAITGFKRNADPVTKNLAEVRSGLWPINLERDVEGRDTSYALIFRNQEVIQGSVLDTLPFPNLGQLRYFGQALDYLKDRKNGETAQFKDYTIKREEKKFQTVSYLLSLKYSSTEFQQMEADIMRKTIKGLR
jgi:hypothetical protein